jgi:hypothetical protein
MLYPQIMTNENHEPKQETPKGAKIPIPTRKDFDRILGKIAKPAKRTPKDSTGSPPEE